MRSSNTFISYTDQRWPILTLAGVLLVGSVSDCGSLGMGNPRQETQQEIQENLSGTQENSAGHTAGRTDGGETGKEGEREKETKEKDIQEKETEGGYKPYIRNRGYGPQVKLPAAHDYRTEGRASQIGNRRSLGMCQAFVPLTAPESSLLPGQRMTLVVDHMPMCNNFLLNQDEGGEYTVPMIYPLTWQRPVLKSEDPYGDGYLSDDPVPRKYVQKIQVLRAKDYNAIKRAVYLEGGVQSSLYTPIRDYQSKFVYYNREINSYCHMGNEKPNHDSVIIGWDDNYSRENLSMDLEGDGAFICTNSWGKDFGDQEYFYVSYYDTNIGVHSIVYTGMEQVSDYDRIHQSDLYGWVSQTGYGQDEVWFSNAYGAGSGEMLAAAGFYATDNDTQYELYVTRHLPEAGSPELKEALNDRTFLVRGKLANAGFHIIPLEKKILLDDDEKSAVIVKIIISGTVHPVTIEYNAGDGIILVDLKDGEGYLSYNGSVWECVEKTQGCNICPKVYIKYK